LFLEEVERVAKIFKSLIREKHVKIISHFDSDGICTASIITKAMVRENVNFELKIIKQLTTEEVPKLNVNKNDILVLTDFGSGQLDLLEDILNKTQILILDHHEPKELSHLNLLHLNPLIFHEEEIPSSMIAYLFVKNIDTRNTDLVDLAIVGAVADEKEEKWKFKGLAKKILEEAEIIGKITVLKGLRLYGRSTRPIHKSLEFSFDPIIPGISGSESAAVQFLSELGISIKEDGEWKKLKDLTIEEQQKLASAIILERLRSKHSDAEDIFGDIYVISGRPEEMQDVREFATLLNACGRLGRWDVGIRLCLDDLKSLEESFDIIAQYRKMISELIEWVRQNKNSILTTDSAIYLFGGNKIPEALIGTVASILLNSNLIDTNKPIFGFAEAAGNKLKISARVSKDLKIVNLRDIISDAAKQVEGEGGGHQFASGGLIPKDRQEEFVKLVDNKLGELFGNKEDKS
jgi:RecJ-like exonuclease